MATSPDEDRTRTGPRTPKGWRAGAPPWGSGGALREDVRDRALHPRLELHELRIPSPERVAKLRLVEHRQRRTDRHGKHVDVVARADRDLGEGRVERVLRVLLRLELHQDVRLTGRSPMDEEPRLELGKLDDLCHPLSQPSARAS